MRGFDGTNHPGGATVLADGFQCAFLYAGTPASLTGKDFTAAQYADYKTHGVGTILTYESSANDFLGGPPAGAQHAHDLWTDCAAKRVDVRDPACATVDMHVAAANIPAAVAYQRSFRLALLSLGWLGPVGGYGFPEVLLALRAAGVADWFWGCGRRVDQPDFVNVWQDNTQTILVGGAQDDIDWILKPLPAPDPPAPISQGDNMLGVGSPARANTQVMVSPLGLRALTPTEAGQSSQLFPRFALDDSTFDQLASQALALEALPKQVADISAQLSALASAVQGLQAGIQATDHDVQVGAQAVDQDVQASLQQLLAAIKAEGTAQVSPDALAAALTAADVPAGIITALATAFATAGKVTTA